MQFNKIKSGTPAKLKATLKKYKKALTMPKASSEIFEDIKEGEEVILSAYEQKKQADLKCLKDREDAILKVIHSTNSPKSKLDKWVNKYV